MNLNISLSSVRTYSGTGCDSHGTIYNMFISDANTILDTSKNRYGTYEYNDNIFGGFSASSSNPNKEFDKEVLAYLNKNGFKFDNKPGEHIRGQHAQYIHTMYEITENGGIKKIDN